MAAVALSLCLTCSTAAWASQVWAARQGQPTSRPLIAMCAWSRGGRVGLWWNASVAPSRAFANAHRYNAVCVAVPWAAALPARGRPAIDLQP